MATFNSILEEMIIDKAKKIFAAKTYIDDHDGQEYALPSLIGFQLRGLKITPVYVSQMYTFCVNPFEFDKDGKLHLSTWSCGGTVKSKGDLSRSVKAFNDEPYCDDYPISMKEYLILVHAGSTPRIEW